MKKVFDINAQPDYSAVTGIKNKYNNNLALVKSGVDFATNTVSSVKKGFQEDSKDVTKLLLKKGIKKIKIKKLLKGTNALLGGVTDGAEIVSGMIQQSGEKEDGTVDPSKQTIATGLSGASKGAALGSIAGPVGTAIGAGVGAVGGAIYGAVTAKQRNEEVKKARQNAENLAASERSNAYTQKEDSTLNMKIKKGMKKLKCKNGISNIKYKKGVRLIETEGREPIFSKPDKKGKRKLIYYNPKAPTHKEGGVKALVKPTTKNLNSGMLEIPEGSSIITANNNMNKKALSAYQKGDHKKLNSIINKMPEDKFQKGTKRLNDPEGDSDKIRLEARRKLLEKNKKERQTKDSIETSNKINSIKEKLKTEKNPTALVKLKNQLKTLEPQKKEIKSEQSSVKNIYKETPKQTSTFTNPTVKNIEKKVEVKSSKPKTLKTKSNQSPNLSVLKDRDTNIGSKITPNFTEPKKIESKEEKKTLSKSSPKNSLGMPDSQIPLLSGVRASAINNLIQGSKASRKTTLNVPTLQLEKYIDRSEPNRKAAQALAKIKEQNARNTSAGSISNYITNANQAEADKFTDLQAINNVEAGRAIDVENRNVERKNEQAQIQTEIKNREIEINQQDQDSNKTRFQTGLNELDEGIYRAKQDYRNEQADKERNKQFDEVNQRILDQKDEELKLMKEEAEKNKKKKGTNKLKLKSLKLK